MVQQLERKDETWKNHTEDDARAKASKTTSNKTQLLGRSQSHLAWMVMVPTRPRIAPIQTSKAATEMMTDDVTMKITMRMTMDSVKTPGPCKEQDTRFQLTIGALEDGRTLELDRKMFSGLSEMLDKLMNDERFLDARANAAKIDFIGRSEMEGLIEFARTGHYRTAEDAFMELLETDRLANDTPLTCLDLERVRKNWLASRISWHPHAPHRFDVRSKRLVSTDLQDEDFFANVWSSRHLWHRMERHRQTRSFLDPRRDIAPHRHRKIWTLDRWRIPGIFIFHARIARAAKDVVMPSVRGVTHSVIWSALREVPAGNGWWLLMLDVLEGLRDDLEEEGEATEGDIRGCLVSNLLCHWFAANSSGWQQIDVFQDWCRRNSVWYGYMKYILAQRCSSCRRLELESEIPIRRSMW